MHVAVSFRPLNKSGAVAISVLVAAVVLAALGAFFWTRASNAPIVRIPNNVSVVVGIGTHGNASSETRTLMSGVEYYRTDITLSSSQESQIMSENRQFGAQYLGILDYETVAGLGANDSWGLDTWNASVSEALKEYPEISTWEIWNEPWVQRFQTGYMNGSAYNYYRMMKSAYGIIKAAEPNATVVCFGGAPISDYYTFEWYAMVWSYGAANYCNAISIHAYTEGNELLNQSGNAQYWADGLSAYWNLTHKQIWITETGMPAYSQAYPAMYGQSVQSAFLVQDVSFFSSFPYVQRMYWYDLWGLSDGAIGNDYGLLNLSEPYSGSPNMAWHYFLAIYNSSASAG